MAFYRGQTAPCNPAQLRPGGLFSYGEASHGETTTNGPGSSEFSGRIYLIESSGFVLFSLTVTDCLGDESTFWTILKDSFLPLWCPSM